MIEISVWHLNPTHKPFLPTSVVTENGHTTLTIRNADADDAGWYQCSGVSVAGSATSRAKVGVEPPKQQKQPEYRIIIPKKSTSKP